MNLVPVASLVFDPTHESPDVIDQRPPNDPTRQQTSGAVPIDPTPGTPLPVVDDPDSRLTVFNGWNIWDVYQSQAPIDPTPGTLDQQLKAWVIDAAALEPEAQVALVSNAAAGPIVQSRESVPEVAQSPLTLGTGGSAVFKRTVAFHTTGDRKSLPWPHDMNYMLDAVYLPAPAPATPAPKPNAPSSSGGGLMLALGLGIGALLLMRGRGRR